MNHVPRFSLRPEGWVGSELVDIYLPSPCFRAEQGIDIEGACLHATEGQFPIDALSINHLVDGWRGYTAATPIAGRTFPSPDSVSSHYFIGRDGTLWQLVSEANRAWHTGPSRWGKRGQWVEPNPDSLSLRMNQHLLGIELANKGDPVRNGVVLPESELEAYTPVQVEKLVALLHDLHARYPKLTRDQVLTHEMIAVTGDHGKPLADGQRIRRPLPPANEVLFRKTDPGRAFDPVVHRLVAEGLMNPRCPIFTLPREDDYHRA